MKTTLTHFLPRLGTSVRDRLFLAVSVALVMSSTPFRANSQTTVAEINADLRQLFSALDTPTQSRRFLFDMACHTTDSTLWYGPIGTDTIDADGFLATYEEMRNMAYDTNYMLHKDTVFYRSLDRRKDTIMMNMLAYDYYTFIDTALTTNTYFNFDTVNNILSDKYPRPGYPFNVEKAFMAAPAVSDLPYRTVTYRVDRSNFFHDEWNDLPVSDINLKIDFGDGTGFHNFGYLSAPAHVTVTYPAGGDFFIKTVVEDAGAMTLRMRESIIHVPVDPDGPAPDTTWNAHDLLISAWYPCATAGAQPMEKVIVYVEGIDVMDITKSTNRMGNEIYQQQIINTGLADLRNFGYTFVVVDWENSRRDMKDNAANIVGLLEDLKCQLAAMHSEQEFVVIGESMGGVVCNYALTDMEKNPGSGCYRDKKHNTRLFITLDAPHQGANIPLSIQHAYKDLTGGIGFIPITQFISTSLGQLVSNAFNLFLDAKAAKQLLIYHASTHDPLLMYSNYRVHGARADWLDDLEDIGGHPKFCKTFAYSNGSLKGHGQTRFFDGTQRAPNDKLLDADQEFYVRLFRQNIKLLGFEADLRTNPNGQGMLSRVEAGRWTVKVRLRWFGIRIRVSPASLISKEHYGDTEPYCTAPGGMYNVSSGSIRDVANIIGRVFCLGSTPTYNGAGTYTMGRHWGGRRFGIGTAGSVYSDGFYWNFVPTYSALDYRKNTLYDDIEAESVAAKMSKTPFDLVMGIHEGYEGIRGTNPFSSELHNRWHLRLRNDFLRDANDDLKRYRTCTGTTNRVKRAINREIGDDSLLLENRTLPWVATHDAFDYIGVDQRSSYYEYDGGSTPENLLGVYSRDENYTIQASGFAHFVTRDITQPGSFDPGALSASSYSTASNGASCCDVDFLQFRTARPGERPLAEKVATRITLYPNPATGGSNIRVRFAAQDDGQSSVRVYDAVGRQVYEKHFSVDGATEHTEEFYLPQSLSAGNYLFVLQNGTNIFRQRVSVLVR